MNLFDRDHNFSEGVPDFQEPHFTYLNRSSRPEAEKIRHLLCAWFAGYPPDHQDELRARFRARNNNIHISAFFELYLHEFLRLLDYKVQVHPSLLHKSNKPDFLATDNDGNSFYLEAVAITGESNKHANERAQIHRLFDTVNHRFRAKKYFVSMQVNRRGKKAPRASALITFIERHLLEVDFDALIAGKIDWQSYRWNWHYNGWEIECFPLARDPEFHSERATHILGITSHGVQKSSAREQIRKALGKKTTKYGPFSIPYIIAINVFGDFVENITFINALFGDDQFTFAVTPEGLVDGNQSRKPNGIWTSSSGPRNTRVSCVFAFRKLDPWRIAHTELCLYHNPEAKHPYFGVLDKFPNYQMIRGNYSHTQGMGSRELFDLPEGWPE